MTNRWEAMSVQTVLKRLQTGKEGLSSAEAQKRLAKQGPNKLVEAPPPSLAELFAKQFQDFMVMVLLAATVISAFLGETIDALAILAIVFINAVLGFLQECKAERSLEALKRLTAPQCTVVRGGHQCQVDASALVPGDIVILEAGDRVPADCRLLSTSVFHVDESTLTGESVPVAKDTDWTAKREAALGDRKNMAFMGTVVTQGRSEAVVVATGMNTEIGQIAELIQSSETEPTPLQKRLEQLGRWLVLACLVIVGVVFVSGVLRGLPPQQMFLTAVSLAVAAIPEGLPAVVTIALAIGVQRMIRRNAIIRKLPAVETLGCATVICSDKTGTLTKNEMTVRTIWLPDRQVDVTGTGYAPEGSFQEGGRAIIPDERPGLRLSLLAGTLCNHAELLPPPKGGLLSRLKPKGPGPNGWSVLGDPTEGALVAAGYKGGLTPDYLKRHYSILHELPFDSERKRMTIVTSGPEGRVSWIKGAPDVIVERCTEILDRGRVREISATDKRRILTANQRLAERALRVLALAYKPLPDGSNLKAIGGRELEEGIVFLGLAGMIDPPRPEVRSAIQLARRAGIRTIMVTGDHKATALAIADELGLSHLEALTGPEIDNMTPEALDLAVTSHDVFARVSPKHKLRIVQSLKRHGEIVAMTGDGVNDAPAVKEADIGIAMGRMGTDVTKEASAMVLADDNYATIVAAVEEGRGIYDNIRKFIRYLLACNVGEVLTMFLATISGLPMPLLPIQILWMNLVTDGLPAIALGVEPPEKDVMSRPPRPPREGVFAHRLHLKILLRGLSIGICTLAVFFLSLTVSPGDQDRARTLAFSTLVLSQLFYVFQCRSERYSVFEIGLLSNPYLVAASLTSMLMQFGVVYFPFARIWFHTVPLDATEWVLVLFFSSWSLLLDGFVRVFRKVVGRRLAVVRVQS